MGKVVIKTALTTAVIIVILSLLTFCFTAFAAPAVLGNLCSEMGLKKASVYYAERAYEKDDKFSDLVILVDRSISLDDYENSAVYTVKLIEDKNFANFCSVTDEYTSGNSYSTYDYYCGQGVEALYKKGDLTASANLAGTKTSVYTRKSPLGRAIVLAVSQKDKQFASQIQQVYSLNSSSITDGSGTLSGDLEMLNKI